MLVREGRKIRVERRVRRDEFQLFSSQKADLGTIKSLADSLNTLSKTSKKLRYKNDGSVEGYITILAMGKEKPAKAYCWATYLRLEVGKDGGNITITVGKSPSPQIKDTEKITGLFGKDLKSENSIKNLAKSIDKRVLKMVNKLYPDYKIISVFFGFTPKIKLLGDKVAWTIGSSPKSLEETGTEDGKRLAKNNPKKILDSLANQLKV